MNTEKPLLQTITPLTDEANPTHACCPTCKTVKEIGNFMRKPTPLQFKLWWGDLPYEKHKKYVGRECNVCAKHRTENKNTFDYALYEATLKLDPKNHVLVPNSFAGKGTPKNPAPTADYIPLYVALVWERRMKGRLALKNARAENYKDRQHPQYIALTLALRKERNRIKMRVRNGASDAAIEFCNAYIAHLVWVAADIQRRREVKNEKARASPLDYVNNDRPETQRAKALFRGLSSKDAELIKPRFL